MSFERTNYPDEHLLKLLKKDDASAFRFIFEKYHPFLCNSSYRILQNREDAKDVVQAVFIHLWDKRNELLIDNLKPYLHRSTINKSLNYLEKEGKKKNTILEDARHSHTATPSNAHDMEVSIARAISLLPPVCKLVFTLSRYDELKNAEIADHLKISVKAVEKHITKALKTLRKSLKEYL